MATETLAKTVSKTDAGLTSSTYSTSTTSSAERYDLDETDERPIFLYTRSDRKNKLKTSSQKDLCAMLDKDDQLRVTKKPLPRVSPYVDVRAHDLYLPEEKQQDIPAIFADAPLAHITMPAGVYWNRLLFNAYDKLYIVSRGQRPADSRRPSPASTWGTNSEATMGSAGGPQHD